MPWIVNLAASIAVALALYTSAHAEGCAEGRVRDLTRDLFYHKDTLTLPRLRAASTWIPPWLMAAIRKEGVLSDAQFREVFQDRYAALVRLTDIEGFEGEKINSDTLMDRFILINSQAGPNPGAEDIFLGPFEKGVPDIVVGRHNLYGVEGVILRNSPSANEKKFLLFIDILRRGALKHLDSDQAGCALHISGSSGPSQTYWALDLGRFSNPELARVAPASLLNLPEDFRIFFKEQYQKRLDRDPEFLDRIYQISKETESRTFLFLKTKESFVDFSKGTIWANHTRPQEFWPANNMWMPLNFREMHFITGKPMKGQWIVKHKQLPNHLEIEGGAFAVISRSPQELLPSEILHKGGPAPLNLGRAPGEVILEIGRFAVTKTALREVSPRIVQQLASAIYGGERIDRIVIKVDEVHRRLYAKYGFKIRQKLPTGPGRPDDFLLETTPEALFAQILKNELAEESLDLFLQAKER